MVAQKLKCKAADILSMELSLYDTQAGSIGGTNGEFIFSSRLDNLASCHAGLQTLIESKGKDPMTRVIAFYDHEEVGSDSAQGAGSPFLKDVLERLTLDSENPREIFFRTMANSFFISADMSHAVHPNYAEKHDAMHMPILNGGPVIKFNSNQSMRLREFRVLGLNHFAKRQGFQCKNLLYAQIWHAVVLLAQSLQQTLAFGP